jgi:group I intron endonuclease
MRKFWEKPIIGIYKITHRESGKCYIGQSVDVFKRWQGHSNLAVKKKSAIQNAFVLYGIDKFSFEVLEECDREMLNDKEVYWISCFDSVAPNGYNLTSGGGQGITVSDETKKKMSDAQKGKKRGPRSEETKKKMSASRRGKKQSEEHKAKMSASMKGKNTGPMSEEQKAKRSASMKGKPQPQVQCPHCNMEGAGNVMKRWHFENCTIYKEMGVPKLGEETAPDSRGLNALLFPK